MRLLDQIQAVEDNHDGRRIHLGLLAELPGGERHRERLARPLVVPHQTLPLVRVHAPVHDRGDGFDLRVARDHLLADRTGGGATRRVQGERAQDLQHHLRAQQQLCRAHHVRKARLHDLVGRRPPVQPRLRRLTNRSVPELASLGRKRHDVRDEKPRNLDLVAVVNVGRAVEPRQVHLRRSFRLTDHQRQTVDPQHQVEAAMLTARMERRLSSHPQIVRPRVLEVDQANLRVAVHADIPDDTSAAQPLHELFVGRNQTVVAD